MGTLVAMGATARFTGPLWGKTPSPVVFNRVKSACVVIQPMQPTWQPTIMCIS